MRPPARTSDAGFTLVELLVAAAVSVLLSALTCWLLAEAKTTIDVSRERADLQQRARAGLAAIVRGLSDAGAGETRGPVIGPLVRWLPPVWPGRADGSSVRVAITTIRVLPMVAPAALASDAPAETAMLAFDRSSGCTLPCGFSDGMTVIILDGRGDFDLFALVDTDGVTATVRRLPGGTGGTYVRGAPVLPVELRSYYWRQADRELRADDGDRGDFPVVNDVVDLAFDYFGEPAPPASPRPPAGEENCLYDASGGPRAGLQTLPRAGGTFAALSESLFQDGPWCGAGAEPFDADLLRIRAVRVRVRLQTGNAAHRGSGARWFRIPGTASDPARFVKDIVFETTITPRNLGGWR
jgi:prepilin-type N-terminal cleavage/methylation domain-containing protein